jgi:hypothetical protein
MRYLLSLLSLLPLLLPPSTAFAAAPSTYTTAPVVLVRVLQLSGIGPDGRVQELYENRSGFVTPLNALGRVGYEVKAGGLMEGGYHTLYVELADRYEVLAADGSLQAKHFSDSGRDTRVRVHGMILVKQGNATPLRMLGENDEHRPPRSRYGDDE